MARFAFIPRKNSHSVVGLLAKHQTLIATFAEDFCRKLIVSAFSLLHAKNVRLDGIEPARDAWHPCQYRIDVPGSYSHGVEAGLAKIKSLVIYQIIGHISFDISHLSFKKKMTP